MYTKGIRKIFSGGVAGGNLEEVKCLAAAAGYQALSFNGYIFIQDTDRGRCVTSRTKGTWYCTVFRIMDFSDNQE